MRFENVYRTMHHEVLGCLPSAVLCTRRGIGLFWNFHRFVSNHENQPSKGRRKTVSISKRSLSSSTFLIGCTAANTIVRIHSFNNETVSLSECRILKGIVGDAHLRRKVSVND
mmetsp:Transcript_14933/g.36655  ORF Transcript_14933/g.36655 Transcript_14933/m.36655 type:complete len:113 (-) Transcript_14933:158-496(-)